MRKLFSAFIFSAFSFSAFTLAAQAPTWTWGTTAGGNSEDIGHSATIDANGNIYTFGQYKSSILQFYNSTFKRTNAGGSNGTSDGYFAKIGSDHQIKWMRHIGGTEDDAITAACTDSKGNIYVAGWYKSSFVDLEDDTIKSNRGQADIFVAKYDPFGYITWIKTMGGSNSEYPFAMSIDKNDNLYVSGYFYSYDFFVGSFDLNNYNIDESHADMFVFKINSDGKVIWARSSGQEDDEIAYAVAADNIGHVYVTGSYRSKKMTYGSNTLVNRDSAYADVFLLQLDSASGLAGWAKTLGGKNHDEGQALAADGSGNCYVTGYFTDSIHLSSSVGLYSTAHSPDIFLAKYDVNGNLQWNAAVTGSDYEQFPYVTLGDANSLYLTGSFLSSTVHLGASQYNNAGGSSGTSDIFLAQYSANTGALAWSTTFGSSADDIPQFLFASKNNILAITGYFSGSTISFGSQTLTNAGGGGSFDVFIAQTTSPSGIWNSAGPGSLSLYPNPTTGKVVVKTEFKNEDTQNGMIRVYNLVGEEVLAQPCLHSSYQDLDLSNMPRGVYFVHVNTPEGNHVGKIVLQ